MTNIADLARAICCPSGRCIAPEACYALDRSRAYPVQIHEAAEAMARIIAAERAKAMGELRDTICQRWHAHTTMVSQAAPPYRVTAAQESDDA